ncbi:uncharacterized protein LOC106081656 [Stomoxys calcitrans]|uniref:uncharacterized protein LOC106081656 n=1 Tax=Stomoxys calcitrans TaxID=35570 RepID=UPI0027E316AB|nr:uncharacterized protein LOC106081656 [Stomoxys calcitrans]
MFRLNALVFVALGASFALVSCQYTYERPARPINEGHSYQQPTSSGSSGGHYFPPLPTIKPLPAVPNLPALPTGRPKVTVNQQALFQTHPTAAVTHPGPTYIPPSGPAFGVGKIAQQYRPSSQGIYNQPPPPTGPSSYGISGSGGTFSTHAPRTGESGLLLGTFTPPTASGIAGHTTQPLRVPFGGTAVIHPLPVEQNPFDGRPLKQYAVIEIIDNDLKQNTEPYLAPAVRDDFRAQFGATGTGATAPAYPGVQIDSRANINILAQQSLSASKDNQISLGSGGLGLVRLADGKIHLGSGSLGYISNEMIRANANEARTRSEMARASALHFGHGSPLQSPISGGLRRF